MNPEKPRFPINLGAKIAMELREVLEPCVERAVVAGSLRRQKPTIGDLEILYIPKIVVRDNPNDLFEPLTVNLVDEALEKLEAQKILERRMNVNGSQVFGKKNKLMRHCATGLPVDLFAATPENWWNYLVCRTGPAESNMKICMAAQKIGWKWNPYSAGFEKPGSGEKHAVTSEQEVFEFVGLPYLHPHER